MNLIKCASFFALSILTITAAYSQTILVSGTATGSFNANTFTSTPDETQSLLGLTFRGSTFSDTTAGGFVAFGGDPANPNHNNFGSLDLANVANVYTGNTFTLRLTFTSPTAVTGDFTADILGQVSDIGGGGVTVDFGGPQTFNWSGGTFTVNVDNTNINPGLTSAITGNIRAVPEPASLCALGVGALGLLRRRRKGTRH